MHASFKNKNKNKNKNKKQTNKDLTHLILRLATLWNENTIIFDLVLHS